MWSRCIKLHSSTSKPSNAQQRGMWVTHAVINAVEALQRPKQSGSIEIEDLYAFYLQCYTIKIPKIVLWQGLAVLPMLVQPSVVKGCSFPKCQGSEDMALCQDQNIILTFS